MQKAQAFILHLFWLLLNNNVQLIKIFDLLKLSLNNLLTREGISLRLKDYKTTLLAFL